MHGLGNDFVVILASDLQSSDEKKLLDHWQEHSSSLAKTLCDRHTGIGADGLILIVDLCDQKEAGTLLPASIRLYPALEKSDIAWVYVNGDGSAASMCGNGLRCLSLCAYENGLFKGKNLSVATVSGPICIEFNNENDICVNLGKPLFHSRDIPMHLRELKRVIQYELTLNDWRFPVTCVNMGNPHCVIFAAPFMDIAQTKEWIAGNTMPKTLIEVAEAIQSLPLFPEGVNVEFAFVQDPGYVRLFVFERGCGATLSCASGAAATMAAGVVENRLSHQAVIEQPGGKLNLKWDNAKQNVFVSGAARTVFQGTVKIICNQSHIEIAPTLGLIGAY